MIAECRSYLITKLKAAMGPETKVCTTMKELKVYADSHVGSVIMDSEGITRDGSRIRVATDAGQTRAIRVFHRELRFLVTLGEYTLEALEPMFEQFLDSLEKELTLSNGYYVSIEPGEVEWIAKDDSILRGELTASLSVIFRGGLYQSISEQQLKKIAIEVERHG